MPRTRRPQKTPANEVAALQSLIDQLIKENQQLRRVIAKAADRGALDLRPVAALVRKVERAISGKPATTSQPTRRPRKPASPETQEKRRQALAKARAVRAERISAQSKLIKLEEPTGGHVEKPPTV